MATTTVTIHNQAGDGYTRANQMMVNRPYDYIYGWLHSRLLFVVTLFSIMCLFFCCLLNKDKNYHVSTEYDFNQQALKARTGTQNIVIYISR